MNRKLCVVLLVLFLMIPYVVFDDPQEIRIDPNLQNGFVVSADGDESSDSITSFSETLDEDLFYVPDFEPALEQDSSSVSLVGHTSTSGSLSDTYTENGVELESSHSISTSAYTLYQLYEWTVNESVGFASSLILTYDFDCAVSSTAVMTFSVYNYSTTSWFILETVTGGGFDTWANSKVLGRDNFDTTLQVRVQIAKPTSVASAANYIYTDHLSFDVTFRDYGYTENFADVSDWNGVNDPITTDGDIATLTSSAGNVWDRYDCNTPDGSVDWFNYYIEVRVKANVSICRFYVYTMNGDNYGTPVAHSEALTTNCPTEWTTYKWISSESDGVPVECISLLFRGLYDCSLEIDYLSISTADETGFQHDGSMISGVTESGSGTVTTDGDKIKFVTGAAGDSVIFTTDTTSTRSSISETYYPFYEFCISSVVDTDADGNVWKLRVYGDDGNSYPIGYSDDTGIFRGNLGSLGLGDIFRFTFYMADINEEVEIDYIKFFSIANFTFSEITDEALTDFVYVDSNKLIVSSVTSDYIQIYNDLLLSVDSATYNVWNLTLQSGSSNVRFYVSVFFDQGETRGEMPSGVSTDFLFRAYGALSISAVTFIEDGTAPSVVRSNVNPPDPEDDEIITLSGLVQDTVEVYTVKFNALTYPNGFSDVDYDATETAADLWTYTFTTLADGYYCFTVIANDGANENDLSTETEFIDFTVRDSEILISPITFFGVGEDFTQMQISFEINKDCSYTIYEVSDTEAESATGSGTVTTGWNNLAWDKLTVTDLQVNFSIKFEVGALSTWINGSYSVAQTAFVLEHAFLTDAETTFTLTGYLTKDASWSLRWDGSSEVSYSGSESAGQITITWSKHETPGAHTWLLTFSNTSSFSLGGSFEVFQTNIDDKPDGNTPDPDLDWRRTQTTWQNIALIIIVLGVAGNIVLGKNQGKLDLPNIEE